LSHCINIPWWADPAQVIDNFPTGDGKGFRVALLRHGILVRDCTSFGLPEYVRIAPQTMSQCQKLIATIKALKRNGELDANV